jgi:hypothetical protein
MIGRQLALGLMAGIPALAISVSAEAQCTGWPVTCTGLHIPAGGAPAAGTVGSTAMGNLGAMRGLGNAGNVLGFGFTILNMMIDASTQADSVPQPQGPASAPQADRAAVSESQKAAILSQIRPVNGAYATSAPSPPQTTSDVAVQKQALLNQIRPTGGSSAPKSVQQARTNGPAEQASAKSREPFDTAKPKSTRTAADQLCQAAGSANNCIGKFNASKSTASAPPGGGGAPPSGVRLPRDGVVVPFIPDRTCSVSLPSDGPVMVGSFGTGPRRAAGFPIAHNLEELRSFDYSDIKANLANVSREQLQKLNAQAAQDIVRLEATNEAIKAKLFAAGLGAGVSVKSLREAVTDGLFEAAKDFVPFWRQMEASGRNEGDHHLKVPLGYLDSLDKTKFEYDVGSGEFARALKGMAETGSVEVTRGYATTLFETAYAVDLASKGDKSGAAEHAGKAAAGMVPAAQWIVPAEALPLLVRLDAHSKVALIALEVGVREWEALADRSEALEGRKISEETARALATRTGALAGKARDLRNIQNLIAQEMHCN